MLRGYRFIVIAALGWLTSAAADNRVTPVQGGAANRAASERQVSPSAAAIANAINNTVRPEEYNPHCEEGEDDRKSDLCAQWKAADSASRAAYWAAWTFFISSLGTLLLVWTLWETRAASRRELRAYVSLSPSWLLLREGGADGASVGVKITNGGSTPAYNCFHAGNIVLLSDEEAGPYFREIKMPSPPGFVARLTLHAHDNMTGEIKGNQKFTPEQLTQMEAGDTTLYFYGFVSYLDTFKRHRVTRFCFKPRDGVKQPAIATSEGDSDSAALLWEVAPYHTDAT